MIGTVLTRTPGPNTAPPRRNRPGDGPPRWAMVVKVILLASANALGVFGAFVAALAGSWLIAAAIVAMLAAIDWVYARKKAVAAKYLLPGVLFLLVYQIFVIGYTGYIAFTNYGDGHNSTKDDAVEAILAQAETRVEGSAGYPLTVVRGDELGFAVVHDGEIVVGTADEPLSPADGTAQDDRVIEVDGWEVLGTGQLAAIQSEVFALRVPLSDDVNDGSLRTTDGLNAYVYRSAIEYDDATDTMTDTASGVVYTADDESGVFAAPDGQQLTPGWRVWVGADNFTRVLTDDRIRGSFASVLVWTFVFAFVSMASTFVLGLALALLLDTKRMRSRRLYRSLLILPNAFPMFLAAFIWFGMLNTDFGFVNQVLLGGARIEWLTDPALARLSVLVLNLWLGFPYMFLVCTGALQSIPDELTEAARMDGAGPWLTLMSVKIPLLMVAVSPVLITTFAFNFNNFNVIYLLTGGGPPDLSAPVPVGSTDILISFVYKLAFGGSGRDYGLACAISLLIFLIVAVVAVVSFRRTRHLEEMFG